MSFETHLAEHLLTAKQERRKLQAEKMAMYHECDCEYCDHDGLMDDFTEDDLDAADRRIDDAERLIESLKAHAKLHGIELKENNK